MAAAIVDEWIINQLPNGEIKISDTIVSTVDTIFCYGGVSDGFVESAFAFSSSPHHGLPENHYAITAKLITEYKQREGEP